MKFPGIYAVYALLIGVGGANVVAIHAGLLVANTLECGWRSRCSAGGCSAPRPAWSPARASRR